MKTTKLWISPDLELRHSPSGWPVEPTEYRIDQEDAYWDRVKIYRLDLDMAKKDSILVVSHGMSTRGMAADSFIDFPSYAHTVWQYYDHNWKDCVGDPINYMDYPTRQVARMKPQTKDVNDNALPDANDKDVASIGLKDRILEAFANALSETGTPGYSCNILSEVLDEIGVK